MWPAPVHCTQTYYLSYDAYHRRTHRNSQPPLKSSMALGMTWIERGSDGRPYFVRKKSKVPFARDLLSDAFAPLRRSSFPFSRSYRQDHYIEPTLLRVPLYLPAPQAQPASHALNIPYQNTQAIAGTNTRAMDSTSYSHHNQGMRESDSDNPRSILKPQRLSYPVPHPTMYPAPPHGVPAMQQPGFGPLPHNPISHQMQQTQIKPPGAYPTQSLPADARIISPPRFPTAEELKYKCYICGRFRSTRYHYNHPLQPWQLPGKTVCHKCQEEATDGEESLSSDSADDHRYHSRRVASQRRSRSRSYAASDIPCPRRTRNRRGRSRSRLEWSDDEYDNELTNVCRSYSRASSLDVEPLRSHSRRPRARRPQSPSVEVFRYIERRPLPQLTQRIVYVADERATGDKDYELGGGDGSQHRTSYRRLSRPPRPSTRIIRRQLSDLTVGTPLALENPDYFSEHYGYVPKARSRSRVRTAPYGRSQQREYTSESDEGSYDNYGQSSSKRPSSLVGGGLGESKGRSEGRCYGRRGEQRSGSVTPRAPSPPGWHEEVETPDFESRRSRKVHEDGPESATPRRRRRARSGSRSQSVEHAQLTSEFVRPGDEVTVIEEHRSRPVQDYDWYDKDGMRVRVRQI